MASEKRVLVSGLEPGLGDVLVPMVMRQKRGKKRMLMWYYCFMLS